MDVRLYALVVIYNRDPADSPSCEQLRLDPAARAVIVDNSTVDNKHYRYAAARGFGYVSMGGNLGLAAAYNRGIGWIRKYTDATHVVLLDDDTTLPDGFLEQMAAAVNTFADAKVFLPRVHDEVGWLSPCRIDRLRVTRTDAPQALSREELTAINSGMVIDLTVFDDYRYDEGYFLDYIDHAFMRDMKAKGISFAVTKTTLEQQFFGNRKGDRAAAKRRLDIFKKDFRRFCGRSLYGRCFATAVIIKRRLRLWLS